MSLRSMTIPIKDMHCAACEGRLENTLKKLPGVAEVKANFAAAEVTVIYDATTADTGMFAACIEKSGYSIGKAPKYEKLLGILLIFAAVFLLGNITDAYDIDTRLKDNVSWLMLFIIGAFTSLHCVGMCGGLLLSQSIRQDPGGKSKTVQKGSDARCDEDARETVRSQGTSNVRNLLKWRRWAFFNGLSEMPALSYNIGRILSYTLLGGAVGALGSVFSLTLTMKAGITLLAGVFMVLMGLNMAGLSPFKGFSIRWPWSGYIAQNARRGPFVVGFFNGLMPCGPLQTMQLYALGTGSAISGAIAMFFFALGTTPLMLLFGSLSGFLSKGYTQKVLKLSGVLVLSLGLIMADRGLALAGLEIPGMRLFRSNTVQQASANKAEIKDGVQIVRIAANSQGYVPNTLFLQKGIPVKWIIDGEQLNSCNNAIVVPTLNIEKPLKTGENIVEFMPPNETEVSFSCWMGMIRGVFKVVDDLSTVDVSKEKPLPSSSGCGGSCCSPDRQGGKTPVSLEQLVQKAKENGNHQAIELKRNKFELEPILSVAKASLPIKMSLIADPNEYAGKRLEIVQVDTKKVMHSFEIKNKLTETEFTLKEPGLYGIVKDRELLGAIEVSNELDRVDLEELRNKYF